MILGGLDIVDGIHMRYFIVKNVLYFLIYVCFLILDSIDRDSNRCCHISHCCVFQNFTSLHQYSPSFFFLHHLVSGVLNPDWFQNYVELAKNIEACGKLIGLLMQKNSSQFHSFFLFYFNCSLYCILPCLCVDKSQTELKRYSELGPWHFQLNPQPSIWCGFQTFGACLHGDITIMKTHQQ